MKENIFGLTMAQWQALYDDAAWKREIASTCAEVAMCQHSLPTDREAALGVLGRFIELDFAPLASDDGKTFPMFMRDVQLAVVRGRPKTLDESVRALMHERMAGVMWTLHTMSQFIAVPQLPEYPTHTLPGSN